MALCANRVSKAGTALGGQREAFYCSHSTFSPLRPTALFACRCASRAERANFPLVSFPLSTAIIQAGSDSGDEKSLQKPTQHQPSTALLGAPLLRLHCVTGAAAMLCHVWEGMCLKPALFAACHTDARERC